MRNIISAGPKKKRMVEFFNSIGQLQTSALRHLQSSELTIVSGDDKKSIRRDN